MPSAFDRGKIMSIKLTALRVRAELEVTEREEILMPVTLEEQLLVQKNFSCGYGMFRELPEPAYTLIAKADPPVSEKAPMEMIEDGSVLERE